MILKYSVVRLMLAIGVSEFAGVVGAFFTTPQIAPWYSQLLKPPFTPPAWVFGPVWITLYALMGIAVFLIWEQGFDKRVIRSALVPFGIQLVLNVLWSMLFFGLHSPLGAYFDIVFLWFAIVVTMVRFSGVSRLAMWLLAPYLAWVSFAAVLNYSIWMLNKV